MLPTTPGSRASLNSAQQNGCRSITGVQSADVQALFDERMQYGFHPVFILAAMLDPKLYPYLYTIPMDKRIQAEELVMKLYETSSSFGAEAVGQMKNYREGNQGSQSMPSRMAP